MLAAQFVRSPPSRCTRWRVNFIICGRLQRYALKTIYFHKSSARSLPSSTPLTCSKRPIDGKYSDHQLVIAVTVLPFTVSQPLSTDGVSGILKRFRSADDVFCSSFLSAIVVQTNGEANTTDTCLTIRIDNEQVPVIQVTVPETGPIPEGPYFLADHVLYEAWRLFPDTADAFFAPVQPDAQDEDA